MKYIKGKVVGELRSHKLLRGHLQQGLCLT